MSNASNGTPSPATPARRQAVIDVLCDAFAHDQLTTRELESRLDVATRARTESELAALLTDLDLASLTSGQDGSAATALTEVRRPAGPVVSSRAGPPARRQFSVGVFSGHSRKGAWEPAADITALAVMGGVELDFREAVFSESVVEVRAVAVMGGVDIVVPPGVRVETSGFAVMGGFEGTSEIDQEPGPNAPTLRVGGFALMGGVSVDVRLPGESSSQARRRRRQERRNVQKRLKG